MLRAINLVVESQRPAPVMTRETPGSSFIKGVRRVLREKYRPALETLLFVSVRD
jgi:hypothetical protein